MTAIYTVEEVLKAIDDRGPQEKEFRKLRAKVWNAKTSEEKKLAKKNLEKFERDNADLMHEMQVRRWNSY